VRMRINLVLPHQLPFPPVRGGGVENLNWMLAQEFARRGHEVLAYSRTVPGTEDREVEEFGVRHIWVKGYDLRPNRWLDHLYGYAYARNLVPILERADVTSFHTPFSFRLCKRLGLGVCVHTIHRTPKWPLPLYRGLDRVYCGSDAVVAQAQLIDPQIRNLKRIYNCIALPTECPKAVARTAGSGLTFLYVGRFVPDKGIESLVRGFSIALREFTKNRLETIGPQTSALGANSGFFHEMSRLVTRHGLSRSVAFRPPEFDRSKLDACISAADVICVPSLMGETFSMAILEAMALGKPVLVSDFSPMPEAVDHRVTGFVARAGEPESLAEGIRFFSERPHELPAFGRAGFEKAQRSFSVERIAGEYLDDFSELIESKQSGGRALVEMRCGKS
jgi:glycosyltransferase involved in cell wall biosynthesis